MSAIKLRGKSVFRTGSKIHLADARPVLAPSKVITLCGLWLDGDPVLKERSLVDANCKTCLRVDVKRPERGT